MTIYFSFHGNIIDNIIKSVTVFLFIFIAHIAFKSNKNRSLLAILIGYNALIILYSFIKDPPPLYANPLNYYLNRYEGIFGTNQLALHGLFLVIFCMLIEWGRATRTKSMIKAGLVVLGVVVILMSSSRTALLTLIFFLAMRRFRLLRRPLFLGCLLALEAVLLFVSAYYAQDILDYIRYSSSESMQVLRFDLYSTQNRLEGSLLSALQISIDHGLMPMGFRISNTLMQNNQIFIDNVYAGILLEYGIFGIAAFLFFAAVMMIRRDNDRVYYVAPFFLILFQLENIFSFIIYNFYFMTLVGLSLRSGETRDSG
jgi:hypothetical protein